MKKLLLCSALLFALPAQAETTEKIGTFKNHQGRLTLSIMRDGKDFERATIFISDKYVVETVLLNLTKEQLQEINQLIEKTLKEMK